MFHMLGAQTLMPVAPTAAQVRIASVQACVMSQNLRQVAPAAVLTHMDPGAQSLVNMQVAPSAAPWEPKHAGELPPLPG